MKTSISYSLFAIVILFASCSINNSKSTDIDELSERISTNISAYWECVEAYSSLNTSAPFVDFNLSGEQPVINGSTYDSWKVNQDKLSISIANRPDASFSIVEAEEDMLRITSDISGVTYTLKRRLMSASITTL